LYAPVVVCVVIRGINASYAGNWVTTE
jgi:hypothetical protein